MNGNSGTNRMLRTGIPGAAGCVMATLSLFVLVLWLEEDGGGGLQIITPGELFSWAVWAIPPVFAVMIPLGAWYRTRTMEWRHRGAAWRWMIRLGGLGVGISATALLFVPALFVTGRVMDLIGLL